MVFFLKKIYTVIRLEQSGKDLVFLDTGKSRGINGS